jgi:glycosyltransferase involved in cell wall biosynthesis
MISAPSSSPNLLMVLPGSFETTGGIGRQVGYLLAEFERAQAPVRVRVLNSRGSGPVALFPFYLTWACLHVLRHRFRREKPVLHVNLASRFSTFRKFFLVQAGRFSGVPVLIHLHGAEFHKFYPSLPKPLQRAVQSMFAAAGCVVVLGDVWRDFLVETVGVDSDKIQIVHNAVPAPAMVSTPNPAARPVRILFCGRLGMRKGVADLLHALATPPLRETHWQAELAGDGDIATFQALAAELGIAERVSFPGWVSQTDVSRKLAAADVFVLPSYNENLPIAVLEALAHGVPVLSTPVGAIPEAVTDGHEGFLVPPGDRATLAARLLTLIENGQLRQQMAAHARATFAERFDIRAGATKFLHCYQRLSKNFS